MQVPKEQLQAWRRWWSERLRQELSERLKRTLLEHERTRGRVGGADGDPVLPARAPAEEQTV